MVCCMFMHACLCTVWFHGWRWIYMVYLHQCLNSICGLKKKMPSRPAASCTNWQVNNVSVGRISACVNDPRLISRGSMWPWEFCPPYPPYPSLPWLQQTTGERTEVLPSPAEGRYAARNLSRTIALSSGQIKHFSMCVVSRSSVFVWDLSVSGLPTVADLAELCTVVDVCPSSHVLL